MTWTEYHEQDDVESFLDYLANTYDFVEVESIGESYEGRPMRVVKVGWLKYIYVLLEKLHNSNNLTLI